MMVYRMMVRMLGFLNKLLPLGGAQMSSCFELCVELIDTYSKNIVHFWYPLIDMYCFVLRVKFENGLSIPVLRGWGSSFHKVKGGNRKDHKKGRLVSNSDGVRNRNSLAVLSSIRCDEGRSEFETNPIVCHDSDIFLK